MEGLTRILHLEDDAADRELIRARLDEAGLLLAIRNARTREEYEAALRAGEFDLILADYRLPSYDGMSALRLARELCPAVPFLFVSGTMGEDVAIEALTEGATDYVLKDRLSRLVPAVLRALKEAGQRREHREAEARVRTLSRAVEQSPVSIIVTDTAGHIQYVNPKFCQITGYAEAEVLGQNPRLLKSGETSPEQYRQLWQTVSGGGVWRGEFHNRKKNGELFWELASVSPIFDESGSITNFVAVKEDITESKRLQDDLRQAQKMEAFGQLAGGVAHDFNNLLTVMQAEISLLQETELTDAQAAGLEEVAAATARAAILTRQLLTFSRRQTPHPTFLDVNELVSNLMKMLQRVIGERVSLAADYAPGRAMVHADAGMLEQALTNLAINARDAMPRGGALTIRTEITRVEDRRRLAEAAANSGAFVCLSVSDTGQGIPPEVLPRIFEPFFTTKGVGKGTGLGLAIVFGIMEQHGGWIETQSEPGLGTTFRLYMPEVVGPAVAVTPVRREFTELRGTETLLLVEDERSLRSAVRKVLRHHGYRVLEARSATDALSVWADHPGEVDLLFTDIVMPGEMNGRELATRLRADAPDLKVIFCSGYSDETPEDGSALRASPDFLQKPFQPQHLLQTVRTCLDRH